MNTIVAVVKKYWPSILPGIVAIWAAYGTSIQHYVSAHPLVASVVAAGYAVFAHLTPSPSQS